MTDVLIDSVESLELPAVLEEVAAHARSIPGRAAVLTTEPESDLERIERALRLVTELMEMIGIEGPLGFVDLAPMEGIWAKLQGAATILDSEEILAVADLLAIEELVRERLDELPGRFSLLREQGQRLIPQGFLKNTISRTVDEHGMVRSTASPKLVGIHQKMSSVRESLRKRLEGFVNDRDLARVVQEDYVTLRNDRYVILLKPEFRGVMDGIVHDHSRSGASVYVEPFPVVELNNQVASLSDEERDEIRRIFKYLSDEIRAAVDDLSVNYRVLSGLDAFQARALYALATGSVSPELVDDGFSILSARHPLLLAAGEQVVPMDVVQPAATKGTVISGANMGGKTVALKIAGLFPLMTRCGILVPAAEGTKIQPFTPIMADIGEEQDIRGRVSSFSAHMLRIKSILECASAGALVLLDEMGGATDPEEGAALSMAIIDELVNRGARVVVTTHLTHLKAYALGRGDVRNVSVEFHPQTMKPTFRLLYDLPGQSHAIATAERIGIPMAVVDGARRYVDRAGGGSSPLLEQLRGKISETEDIRRDLEEKQHALSERLRTVEAERETVVEEFRKEAREMMRKAERQISDLQQSLKKGKIKEKQHPREVVESLKQEIGHTLGVPLEKRVVLPDVGSRVRVKSLGREGVVRAHRDGGRVEVVVGSVTITADGEDLQTVAPRAEKKSSLKTNRFGVEIPLAAPAWEVNVIGLRVDEALPIVERALDRAVLGGLSSISIIHGKGTGRLKKAVREYLSKHDLVRAYRSEDLRAGGEGVTVVDVEYE